MYSLTKNINNYTKYINKDNYSKYINKSNYTKCINKSNYNINNNIIQIMLYDIDYQ